MFSRYTPHALLVAAGFIVVLVMEILGKVMG
jgi:hypothetical protein